MNIKHENHLRHIHPERHPKHPKQILQTKHIYNKLKRTTSGLCGEEGGVCLAVYVESEYLFPIFCGRRYLFSSNFRTDILFKDMAYLNLMDAGLFIYFPRDPG